MNQKHKVSLVKIVLIYFNFQRVIAFMVMSIISSLFAIPLIVFSGIGLDWANYSDYGSELLLWPQALTKIQI